MEATLRNARAGATSYAPYVRTHRLIAGVRVVSASLTTLALLGLGPSVARHGILTIGIELAYLALASILLVQTLRHPYVALNRPVGMLAIDLTVVLILLAETGRTATPFFASALFVVWAAEYLAGTRAGFVVAGFLMGGWLIMAATEGMAAAMSRPLFMVRTAMIVAVPAILAWRRAYDQRNQSELSKLAAWPRGERQREDIVRAMMQCAADIAHVPRVIIVWEEEEEPWVSAADWEAQRFAFEREPPETRDVLMMTAAAEASLLASKGTEAMLFRIGEQPARPFSKLALDGALRKRLGNGSVMSAAIRGGNVSGRLYLLGRDSITSDELTLSEIVAGLIAAELDRLVLVEKIRAGAVADERTRLASSLHDGLLQSMTAVTVQLSTLEAQFARDPAAAGATLRNLRQIVADDQRELRDFVDQARDQPEPPRRALEESLRQFVDHFEQRWGIRVELDLDPFPDALPQDVATGIYGIVHEGLANAAKHAGARRVRAQVGVDDSQIEIMIDDDGRGFPFHGRFDLATLVGQRRAPAALRQHVTSLNGEMVIDSSPAGSRLQIRLPM
jgi:signal transduction histidine kinase